jgi:hypothetical protein
MRTSSAVRVVGAVAAVAGGLLWAVKSLAILATGIQPAGLFEAAPAVFGVAITALALSGGRRHRHMRVALLLAAVATVAGLVAIVSEIAGELFGLAIAIAMVAVITDLILIGTASEPAPRARRARDPSTIALVIGVATIPLIVLGGLLSPINERLLEGPLLVLSLMWIALGLAMLPPDHRVTGHAD